MRRAIAFAVCLPLALAGSFPAHQIGYLLASPDAKASAELLAQTGHSYLDQVPLVLGVAVALALAALVGELALARRGDGMTRVPVWSLALVAPVGFTVQEHVERLIHDGAFPWDAVLAPSFRYGLLLQIPFALLAYGVARFLLRAAGSLGRALHQSPPAAILLSAASGWSVVPATLHAGVVARGPVQRGPPVLIVL